MPEKSQNPSDPTRSDMPSSAAALSSAVRLHLGKQLRNLYGDPSEDKLPRDLARLADRVAQVIRAHTEPVDQEFVNGVMDALPNLRAFALSLTGKVDQAERLLLDPPQDQPRGRGWGRHPCRQHDRHSRPGGQARASGSFDGAREAASGTA